jgi:hypothetical protein
MILVLNLLYTKILSTKRKLLIVGLLSLGALNMHAQKNNEVTITSANIESTLTGKWNMEKVQPNDKGVIIKGFTMKGAGYGEIIKGDAQGGSKIIVSKIFGMNQNAICFADGEGSRIVYKIISITKSTMCLTDGVYTIDFTKE